MPFKINISKNGKTARFETENEALMGLKIGGTMKGEDVNADLAGYVLQITGTSDSAGFAGKKELEGPGLQRVLLTKGFGMKKKPKKEGRKKVPTPKGLRLRKTLRGNIISKDTVQINTVIKQEGNKKFEDFLKKPEAKEEKQEQQKPEGEEKKTEEEKKPEVKAE